MNCLLTIALLTKNSEKTVGYALTSLAMQNVPKGSELEIIVVNGYSKDKILEILNYYMPKLRQKLGRVLRRTLIVKEGVNTVGFARNLALKLAEGEWILWLGSDNVLHSDYLVKAFEAIEYLPRRMRSSIPSVSYPSIT